MNIEIANTLITYSKNRDAYTIEEKIIILKEIEMQLKKPDAKLLDYF
jgi:hypothetical protein